MIVHGDCLEVLRTLPDSSVDAIVTDPPYGLSFMGKKWDHDVPSVEIFRECLRVLKPGGHALIACGTRTQHRMAVNIEDAGFEIRDVITWLYGSGFPKSLDVSKAIDKAAGAAREVVGTKLGQPGYSLADNGRTNEVYGDYHNPNAECAITAPSTEAAKQWAGWGTALKPACEFWTLARKPLAGTVAANMLKYGVGGINVDGCRIGYAEKEPNLREDKGGWVESAKVDKSIWGTGTADRKPPDTQGRFPANLILDEMAAELLDEQTGELKTNPGTARSTHDAGMFGIETQPGRVLSTGSTGGASRFFYVAKASKSERNAGCEGMPEKMVGMSGGAQAQGEGYDACQGIGLNRVSAMKNHHPTVKPVKLMRYLCRLITPPGGIVLDPFMGSGSTGVAALKEGFQFTGIEREAEYVAIAEARLRA